MTEFAERQPYYPSILRSMPKLGQSSPSLETRQGFALTHAALCARDAADEDRTVSIPKTLWEG